MLSWKFGLIALAAMFSVPGFAQPALAQPAHAQASEDEIAVRDVIADWYRRVSTLKADRPWAIMAPSAIYDGPGYSVPADLHSGNAGLRGPWLNHEMAARAMQFAYDVDAVKVDPRLAKVMVWERGYWFASAAQKTYELGARSMFVLEKQADGRWLILAHSVNSEGIPPNKVTDPMPDLKALYYERCGDACDPVADARKAAEW